MAKPCGTVSSTSVVVAFSSSVGTAREKSCRCLASATDGLISACAQALEQNTSAASIASGSAKRRLPARGLSMGGLPSSRFCTRPEPPGRSAGGQRRRAGAEGEREGRTAKRRPEEVGDALDERDAGQPPAQERDRAPHPAEDVLDGGAERRGDRGQGSQHRDRVAV